MDYRWPGLREWYTNSAAGLKHNITVEQPIAAQQLQVDLALAGTLRPHVAADGQAVALRDVAGAAVLDFGALYVYDAAGRTLPARFGPPQDGGATVSRTSCRPFLDWPSGGAKRCSIVHTATGSSSADGDWACCTSRRGRFTKPC